MDIFSFLFHYCRPVKPGPRMPQTDTVALNGRSNHNGSEQKNAERPSEHHNGYHIPHRKVFDNGDQFQRNEIEVEEVDSSVRLLTNVFTVILYRYT